METIRVIVNEAGSVLAVVCPYSRDFVDFAKMRNAKWSDGKKVWLFDPRDEFAVRSTLIDIYGTDDSESCEKVDVRVKLDAISVSGDRLFFLGRELVWRRYRDSYVLLGDGVVVVQGGFPPVGGSRRGPELEPQPGTVLEARGVPVGMAERTRQEHPEAIEILGELDLVKLQQERELLLKRIREIDQIIERYGQVSPEEDIIADLQDEPNGTPESGGREAVQG